LNSGREDNVRPAQVKRGWFRRLGFCGGETEKSSIPLYCPPVLVLGKAVACSDNASCNARASRVRSNGFRNIGCSISLSVGAQHCGFSSTATLRHATDNGLIVHMFILSK
jgi:hypothetical protein